MATRTCVWRLLRHLSIIGIIGRLCLATCSCTAFVPMIPPQRPFAATSLRAESQSSSLLDEIGAMKVRDIKAELRSYGVGSEDVFEKRDLVDRLLAVRRGEISAAPGSVGRAPRTNGAAKAAAANARNRSAETQGPGADVPLEFFSLESFQSVDTSSAGQSVYVRPSPGQFACIQAQLPYKGTTLTLLVDTACSGVVLRPSSVRRLNIPTFKNTFGSMAAAGGNVANTAVAQLESLKVGGITTGAMPAAVQDIGALPSGIDGIIGLTFLNQYATVDMSFDQGRLQLYRRQMNPPTPGLVELAKTKMKETRLKIYTAKVMLDGRGPVTMLVDTGAASSILNWRGVSQMGLGRDSPEISPTPNDIGAIGADNVALRLTHRYVLREGFNLDDEGNGGLPGVRLGSDSAVVNLDVGDIPVLESLANEQVGGILGADLLMQSDLVRLHFRGPVEGQLQLFGTSSGVKKDSEATSAEAPPRKKKKKKVRSD